ncbi:Peptidase T [Pseudovibrio axinellae]|uniref:Peptidase T n=1 Tax=Pseudovibrio axinellae TaxID=989403 RepID=A0A166ASK4_9HYPH|nr:peptidase T [Pseudovibrio axinellae]KZL21498.1 Peptidase T [Pseudovibrio axinellae]SER07230.1 tripeptide aminopeptidase [Pseudovibrio axinellae]
MRTEFDRELEERLVRYAAIDTQSDETCPDSPSTQIQLDLQHVLRAELMEIGASDVVLTEYGVVLATIPATVDGDIPVVGLVAHVDTAPAYHAVGVKPVVHREYDGAVISFADAPELSLSPEVSSYLASKVGDDIITASGATLLGADDKAGVAIIMSLARHLLANPDIKHGKLRIAFTPDEEIGRGVHDDLAKDFGADFAYTLDGGRVGELNYENFCADGAVVKIAGVSVHPGYAKNKLVNALHLAGKIISTLPQATMTPETTDGREGFIFVSDMQGTAAEAELHFVLRDFELEGLEAKADLLEQVCAAVQATEPRATITCDVKQQYRNMHHWLREDMTPVDLAKAAYADVGLTVSSKPIRGGTDGSVLTAEGIPTPNIFTGMQEIHGPLEWISVQDMALATQVCLKLVERVAK